MFSRQPAEPAPCVHVGSITFTFTFTLFFLLWWHHNYRSLLRQSSEEQGERTRSRRPSSEETLARPAQQAWASPSSASSPVAKPNPSPPLSNQAPSLYLGLLLASLHPTLRWAEGCGEGRIGFLFLFLKRLVTDMGASLSNLTVDVGDGSGGPGLGDIPESCVACVFTYLTPPEICNLARLNRAFRGAASSDSVWELKLPPTYPQLVSLLPPDASLLSKKKDIFAFLSRPVPFDDRYKVR